MKKQMFYLFSVAVTVTENLSNKGFRFLKSSDFKQLKSFVRIGRNSKANMSLNNNEWHIKTYIHQSAMKISII